MGKILKSKAYPANFLAWAWVTEGFFSSSVLWRGDRYLPSEDADIALAVEMSAAAPAIPGLDARSDVIASRPHNNGPGALSDADSRIAEHICATRDLLLFEMDWTACESLMSRSRTFRELFLRATTMRLRNLHERRRHAAADKSNSPFETDYLLSPWPTSPLDQAQRHWMH